MAKKQTKIKTRNKKQLYHFKAPYVIDVSTIDDIVKRRKLDLMEMVELAEGKIKKTSQGWHL